MEAFSTIDREPTVLGSAGVRLNVKVENVFKVTFFFFFEETVKLIGILPSLSTGDSVTVYRSRVEQLSLDGCVWPLPIFQLDCDFFVVVVKLLI